MIPFGPWHPDKAGINTAACHIAKGVLPGAGGFRPARSLAPLSLNALDGSCRGAATMISDTGAVHSFAGDATKLYKLSGTGSWANVSRTTGGAYSVGSGERWRFEAFGNVVVAITAGTPPQKYTVGTSTNFEALGGLPPQARCSAVVRDFLVLGNLSNAESTVRWSGLNNIEHWTIGSQSADQQVFPNGGPVRGLIGGEVGYVFQAGRIVRMIYLPGDEAVFQFDEVEGGRGLAAPASLVQVGRIAYYLGPDGFYKFDIGGGASEPIGVGKWEKTVRADIKPGTESLVVGGADLSNRLVIWAYLAKDSPSASTPSRCLVYDWALDEATILDISVDAIAQWLTQGVTLEGLDSFGTVDTLPFSMDSPFWRGGAAALAVFSTNRKLSFMSGTPLQAEFVTADGMRQRRQFISGTRPLIDTTSATVALAMRERDGDAVVYGAAEAMEDTGVCPGHASGNLARARIIVPSGAVWSQMEGIETVHRVQGRR